MASECVSLGNVWYRARGFVVESCARTTARLSQGIGVERLDEKCDDNALGAAIRRALRPMPTIAHPTQDEWPAVQRQWLEMMGVKRWSDFASRALLVSAVRTTDGRVLFEPKIDHGSREGFRPMLVRIDRRWTATDEQLGVAARAALEHAR